MIHVGMMYERIPAGIGHGGIHLHQEPYCMALKPIEYDKTKKHDVETNAKDQHKFMVCIGGLLHLCLTRWDLIVDIVVLQQFVRKPNYGHMHGADLVIKRAKSNAFRGLKCLPLKPPLRLLDISDASHAGKRTSYAIGQIDILTTETGLQLRPGNNELTAAELQKFLSSSDAAHPLSGSGKTAKRISHSTSHAESLAKNSSSGHASMKAMRLTEMSCPLSDRHGALRAPTIDELLDMEVDGLYDLPIDSLTDC